MTDQMDDIERDLSQSRENLKDSVSALGEKLTFGQLIDEVIEKSGFDVGSAKSAMGDAAKLTIPGAVLGAGVALLVANLGALKRNGGESTKSSDGYDFSKDWRTQEQYRSAASLEEQNKRSADEDDTSYRKRIRSLQADVLGYKREPDEADHSFHARIESGLAAAKSAAQEAGSRLAGAASATANGAMGMANGAADAVRKTAAGAASAISDGAKSGAHRAQAMYEENPVLGVAVGVAVGALLGALVPLSRKEQEVLGEPVAKAAAAVAEAGERAAQDIGRGVRAAGAEHRQPAA